MARAHGSIGDVGFDRRARGLTGLVVKGILLQVVTFGIYRFWYITNLRRFFWSRTVVAGSPAEYIGRGKELFLGFLVALAIVIPVNFGLFLLSLLDQTLALFSGPISFVFLFLLGQYAIYRGRRYRASRTLWRGIRLAQDGSAGTYIAMATGWWLLTVLTLGLAFPFMRASLERYRMNHTLLGDSRLTSTATGRSVLLPWLLFYALVLVPTVALIAYGSATHDFSGLADLLASDAEQGDDAATAKLLKEFAPVLIFYGIVISVLIPAVFLLIPFYRARETRAFMNATTLGPSRLVSTLKARQFYWPYILYFLVSIGLTVVIVAMFGAVFFLLALVTGGGENEGRELGRSFGLIGVIASYVAVVVVSAVLYIRVVTVRLWDAVATTTTIDNVDALEEVLASSRRPGSALNEGLADALDVGGAIEIGF